MNKKVAIVLGIGGALVAAMWIAILAIFVHNKMNEDSDAVSYYKAFDEDDVVYPDDGEAYVDNQLIIKTVKDASLREVKKLVRHEDGEIVGRNKITSMYQVEFDEDDDVNLEDMIEEFEDEDIVVYATLNYVYNAQPVIEGSVDLDNTVMGFSDVNSDSELVGTLNVCLVGSGSNNSGIGDLVDGSVVNGIKPGKDGKISLYEWECDSTNQVAEFDENTLFEMGITLEPTYAGDSGEENNRLNKATAEFINDLSESDEEFMFITSQTSEEGGFMAGIDDEDAKKRIITVSGDENAASGTSDVITMGDRAQSLEYATSAALLTWGYNKELTAENVRDILKLSYVEYPSDDRQILDVSIATEVSSRLADLHASKTNAGEEIDIDDIRKVLDEVKAEGGYGLGDDKDAAGEAYASEDYQINALAKKAGELGDEMGYVSTGTFGKEAFTEFSGNNAGNTYCEMCNYNDNGCLKDRIIEFEEGHYSLIEFYIQDCKIYADMYTVNHESGEVELTDTQKMCENGVGVNWIGGAFDDYSILDGINNMSLGDKSQYSGVIGQYIEEMSIALDIVSTDTGVYITEYTYSYARFNSTFALHKLVLYQISGDGIEKTKGISANNTPGEAESFEVLNIYTYIYDESGNEITETEIIPSIDQSALDNMTMDGDLSDYFEEMDKCLVVAIGELNATLDSYGLSSYELTGEQTFDGWYSYRMIPTSEAVLEIKVYQDEDAICNMADYSDHIHFAIVVNDAD